MPEHVRFSPAPSGMLHIGGARTALFDWLVARRDGGTFVLRVEDTDASRATAASEAAILEDLAWLGLDWDEGPGADGPNGPYRQSQRSAHYERSLRALRLADAVYPCFCSRDLLAAERAEDVAAGRPPRYRGTCRELPEDEVLRRFEAGEEAAWRFAVPSTEREVGWIDRVHGLVVFSSADIGDFVVMRADGQALYDLASVTDDAAMRITLVLRGDDHIPNTPRQLLLYEALGLEPPAFGHLPLVTAEDGVPLSKSAGGESIADLRKQGFLPEAVVDHLARLGWSDPLDRPALARDELIAAFDLARVSPAPPRHDAASMRAINARHLRALPADRLADALRPYTPPLPAWLDPVAFAEAVRGDLQVLCDAYPFAEGLIAPQADEEAAAALAAAAVTGVLAAARDAVKATEPFGGEAAYRALRDRLGGADPRIALPAVRAALCGRAHGLPLPALFSLLGKGRSLERLTRAEQTPAIDTSDGGNG